MSPVGVGRARRLLHAMVGVLGAYPVGASNFPSSPEPPDAGIVSVLVVCIESSTPFVREESFLAGVPSEAILRESALYAEGSSSDLFIVLDNASVIRSFDVPKLS